jgi:hypothetical protein
MAPEQKRGEPVDQRADAFAIGAMLWERCVPRAASMAGSARISTRASPASRWCCRRYANRLEDLGTLIYFADLRTHIRWSAPPL